MPSLVVKAPHLGEFVGDPFVGRDAVVVPALDHEGPGRDQAREVGVVHHVGEVEFEHVVFAGQHVTVARVDAGGLPHPLVEVGGADGKRIALQQRRDAHRGLAAIGEAVEADPLHVDERQPHRATPECADAARG